MVVPHCDVQQRQQQKRCSVVVLLPERRVLSDAGWPEASVTGFISWPSLSVGLVIFGDCFAIMQTCPKRILRDITNKPTALLASLRTITTKTQLGPAVYMAVAQLFHFILTLLSDSSIFCAYFICHLKIILLWLQGPSYSETKMRRKFEL